MINDFPNYTPEDARKTLFHASPEAIRKVAPHLTTTQRAYCIRTLPPHKAALIQNCWDENKPN